jgi:Zn finger protein HypA/HybF involved in hydrogenase expression
MKIGILPIDKINLSKLSLLVNNKFGGKPVQAYCVKCRAKKEMKNPQSITMKNGKPATTGTCPDCSTKMFRIGKS